MFNGNVSVGSDTLRRIEYVVGIALSVFAIIFLGIRAAHAGALWRDECDSVATATLPDFSAVLHYFQFDSFPLPFVLALRGYIAIAGNSDASLRVFGALVGVSLLLVGWWTARRLRVEVPLVFLALAVLNPAFLVWGTTVRGYGIGSVIIVFAFAATANFLANGTTRNAFLMMMAFVAAVQCLVSNTALVFAICLAAVGVCFMRGDRKTVVVVMTPLAIAALSFLPYVATYFKMGWHVLLQTDVSLVVLWNIFRYSLGARNSVTAAAWAGVISIAGFSWILRIAKRAASQLVAFALLTALFSLVGSFIFLKLLSYTAQVWYFLPFICLLAGGIDLAYPTFASIRVVRLVLCVVAVAGTWWSNWPTLTARQSNIDLVADRLGAQAQAGDLVLVNPWFFGVSFNRYYRGVAPWLTVPILSDLRIHRYDLIRERMSEEDPLGDLRPTIESTLRHGGRVYLVGGVQLVGENERALVLPPAPRSQYGWNYLPYVIAWSQQIGEFLQAHVQASREVPQLAERINAEENIPLWEVSGWHD
jgi:hypothetical protein